MVEVDTSIMHVNEMRESFNPSHHIKTTVVERLPCSLQVYESETTHEDDEGINSESQNCDFC